VDLCASPIHRRESTESGQLHVAEHKKASQMPKIVNLALQGGGSHGAFTWGVLDRLLEEEALHFEGISGTSAGAVNAVVLADGLAAGGREGAREALTVYWQKVSALTARGIFRPSLIDKKNPDFGLEHSLGFYFFEPMTYFASPYQMNPLNYNPFKDCWRRPSTSSAYADKRHSNYFCAPPTFRQPK
jgi:NTE family protein